MVHHHHLHQPGGKQIQASTPDNSQLPGKDKGKKSVADPDLGSGAFLTPGSGMGNKPGFGCGMNNPDHISESLESIFWVKIL